MLPSEPLRRVQLKRVKGWRMPPNTAKVDRTTRWGNHPAAAASLRGLDAVNAFEEWVRLEASTEWKQSALRALKGRNLACWCKSGEPCHAEFLLTWVAREDLEAELPRKSP
jgi:Domain of unknown function (DUF4326)